MGLNYKIRRFAHDDDAIRKALRPFNKHKKIEKKSISVVIFIECHSICKQQPLSTRSFTRATIYLHIHNTHSMCLYLPNKTNGQSNQYKM